ncbi:hypothetical protein FXN61_35210 [Lentzea sp. PSKA42]|uniref:Uncharacterized protein n=1 Tax=Lentzea indica TaxID=2604800 RepID=A0ABX1FSC5_9PSEU|nr:hypothetical protein [Lentzea indica]NKE61729.1 hypothetical protein [Lentzea indica]
MLPESAFERAKRGTGQLFAVNKPAGAERTQYLIQAAELARTHGFAVTWVGCRADAPAFWPWHAILAGLGGDAAALDADPEVCAQKVLDVLSAAPALILVDDIDVAGEEAFQLTQVVAGNVHHLPVVIVATSTGTTSLDDTVRLVERAHAVLAKGGITEARDLLDQAARDGDPEAALGLPGMWVNKFRGRADRALAIARLRNALATGPAEPLRTRLSVRLAAEQAYDRRETESVLEALERARNTGDQLTLAEALSLAHHALWSPEHAVARLALTGELIAVASAAGLDLLALSGLCRRTMDLFCLGDPHAERSQVELARRAAGHPALLFFHAAMDVMRTIRAGRFAEAEQKSLACLRIGLEAGDVDAETFHSTHLFAIRWLQGRGGELVDLAEQVTHSPTLPDLEFSFEAAHALLALEAGQRDRARSALHRLTINGLTAVSVVQHLDHVHVLRGARGRRPRRGGDRPGGPRVARTVRGPAGRAGHRDRLLRLHRTAARHRRDDVRRQRPRHRTPGARGHHQHPAGQPADDRLRPRNPRTDRGWRAGTGVVRRRHHRRDRDRHDRTSRAVDTGSRRGG